MSPLINQAQGKRDTGGGEEEEEAAPREERTSLPVGSGFITDRKRARVAYPPALAPTTPSTRIEANVLDANAAAGSGSCRVW